MCLFQCSRSEEHLPSEEQRRDNNRHRPETNLLIETQLGQNGTHDCEQCVADEELI